MVFKEITKWVKKYAFAVYGGKKESNIFWFSLGSVEHSGTQMPGESNGVYSVFFTSLYHTTYKIFYSPSSNWCQRLPETSKIILSTVRCPLWQVCHPVASFTAATSEQRICSILPCHSGWMNAEANADLGSTGLWSGLCTARVIHILDIKTFASVVLGLTKCDIYPVWLQRQRAMLWDLLAIMGWDWLCLSFEVSHVELNKWAGCWGLISWRETNISMGLFIWPNTGA